MFLDDGRRFLLAARRRKGSAASHYDITTSQSVGAGARYAPGYLGKLKANFVGTEFQLFDAGAKPGGGGGGGGAPRRELGAVAYETNILGTKGPRKMLVALPAAEAARAAAPAPAPAAPAPPPPPPAAVLRNKAPRWNDSMRAFCLNFGGRVTTASVKNFQLAADGDAETVVLQFGKAGDETFTCDFRWPLTPLQAFAICLSSFDSKLACE
ncbi:MAG: tubby C-terminal-like domain-containing protein [Monoraphidium minutum]|nr:MAG: tubby C-terminal-like domain-containing protein [Monoraphidium minutum]